MGQASHSSSTSAYLRDLLLGVDALSTRTTLAAEKWEREHGQAAPAAAQSIALLIKDIARRTQEAVEQATAGGISKTLDEVRALGEIASVGGHFQEMLDHSSHRSLHPVLSPMVQSQLSRLGVPGHVLVTGTRDLSYELHTHERSVFAQLVSPETIKRIEWPLLVFRIPHPPLDWPLHHVLIFHELGHALFRHGGGPGALPMPQEILDEVAAASNQGPTAMLKAYGKQAAYLKYFPQWYEEIFADAVGISMAGPAFVAAACRIFGGNFTIDGCSHSHPPTALRIKLMLGALRSRGLWDALPAQSQSVLADWEVVVDQIVATGVYKPPAMADQEFPALASLMVQELLAQYPQIINHVDGLVAGSAYTASMLREDLVRGVVMHEHGIPPIEESLSPNLKAAGIPLNAARVFSACWAAYRVCIERDQLTSENSERYAAVLLESLDASEALRIWRDPA